MIASSVVQVDSYSRTLPRKKLAVHRSVCSETEFDFLATRLTDELIAGEQLHDEKSQRTRQDVVAGKNVCCRSILRLLFARIAAGEKLHTVLEFVDTLRAIVIARYPSEPRCTDLRAVQQMECAIESAMNPLQFSVNSGDMSAPTLRKLLRLALRYREVLDDLIACLQAKLAPKVMS